MGLKNLLIVALVVWVGVVLWRRLQARRPPQTGAGAPERMVRCEECGVYLPLRDAVARGAGHYACTSHPPAPRA